MRRITATATAVVLGAALLVACNGQADEDCDAAGSTSVELVAAVAGKGGGGSRSGGGSRGGTSLNKSGGGSGKSSNGKGSGRKGTSSGKGSTGHGSRHADDWDDCDDD